MEITRNQITFTQIASGKWQAMLDGARISSAHIVGGNGCWSLQGQKSADTLARFTTRIDAARYQLACVYSSYPA